MKQHILFIDDDKDELSIFLDALKEVRVEDGFKCTYAGNAGHAFIMLQYLKPDVIFVDLNMRGLNGLEFLADFNQHDYRSDRHIRIFLYSNMLTDTVKERAMALGACGCVNKRNNTAELVAELESIFTETLAFAHAPQKGPRAGDGNK